MDKLRQALFFLTVLCLLMPSYAEAQQTKITVLDKESKQPVSYAHLKIEALDGSFQRQAITNEQGKVHTTVKSKSEVTISYVGYETLHDTITPGKKVTYLLKPSALDMEEVVITGQYTPERTDNSIYKIKVLDSKKIKMKAANNLRDMLASELNFKISQDNILGSSLSLQGVSGENVKILVDGVPVIGRMNGDLNLSQLNLNNVERIEIVEGPMSVSYGTNALAGAINIITKDHVRDNLEGTINTYYESVGRYNIDASVAFSRQDDSFLFSGGRNFFDGYNIKDTSRNVQWKPKEQYFGDFKYKHAYEDLRLRLASRLFRETVLDKGPPVRAVNTDEGYYYYRARDGYYKTWRASQKASLTGNISNRNYVDLSFSYSFYRRNKEVYQKNLYTQEKKLVDNPDDLDTSTFHAWQFRGTMSRNKRDTTRLRYQIGYDISMESGRGSKIEKNNQTINDYALFASLKYRFFDNLLVQAGSRLAYNTQYDPPVTPSLNFKYDISEQFHFRASYGKGFRAPSLKELYLSFQDLNHDIRGNQNLQAENSDNFKVSGVFSRKTEAYGFKIEPDFFYNSIENRIGLIERTELNNSGGQVDTSLYYSYQNYDVYKTLGYRIRFHYEHKDIVGFTLGYSRIGRYNEFAKGLSNGEDYVFSPELVLKMRYDFTPFGTQFNLDYKYTGELERYQITFDNEYVKYTEADYHMLDFSLNQSFFENKLDVVAGVKNIFDVNNIRTTGTTDGVHSGSGSSRPVRWGRTFFMDVSYNF
ncbi:MAG: TonB-dependent receptor [Bacteroidales bacterium]|nr:TonB-dependent receptor [Bacteroidales bacterium]MCF8334270.1 TonB-dependent receptor [Bacteroidales bacterium]